MAGDILATSASIVGVEREFSTARRQAEFNRTYRPDTFEAIMIAKSAIREENAQTIEDALFSESIGDDLGLPCANLREEVETRKKHLLEILEEDNGFISDGPDSDGGEDEDREPAIEISDDERSDDDIFDEEGSIDNPSPEEDSLGDLFVEEDSYRDELESVDILATASSDVVIPDSLRPVKRQRYIPLNVRGGKKRRTC